MNSMKIKKIVIPNLPYAFIALFATKLGQAIRLSPGTNPSERLLHIVEGLTLAFQSKLPSFQPFDLCIGIALAVLLRIAVSIKGKNAKKFRKNMEYGTARWGNHEDIAPFMDPNPRNNVVLTATEGLMMSNRPKNPKDARNKNVLVIGGSGSGKTRFFVLPNLMQCHSSYVVTDPKGYNVPRQTQRNDAACRKNLPKGASTIWQQRQTRLPPYMSDCPVTMSSRVRATAS